MARPPAEQFGKRRLPPLESSPPAKRSGHVALLVMGTLGIGKTAEGLDAIRWWREGRVMEVAEYCCFDVKVTKLVHEHGARHGELFYEDRFSRKQRLEVNWKAE